MGYQQIRQVFTGCLFGFDYQDLRLAGTVGVAVLGGFCGFPFAFFDGEQTLQAANPANEVLVQKHFVNLGQVPGSTRLTLQVGFEDELQRPGFLSKRPKTKRAGRAGKSVQNLVGAPDLFLPAPSSCGIHCHQFDQINIP